MSDVIHSEEQEVKGSLLSFKPLGRLLSVENISQEFEMMRREIENAHLKSQSDAAEKIIARDKLEGDDAERIRHKHQEIAEQKIANGVGSPESFFRVGLGSGTHTLKMLTTKAKPCVLDFDPIIGRKHVLPSVNAPDIPFAKIVYRILEIEGREPRSLVDYIVNPDDLTDQVRAAFSQAFSPEHLAELERGLATPKEIPFLPESEFPVFFLPGIDQDIQITPVSPFASYMALKKVTGKYFLKQEKDGPKVPRGKWFRQSLTAKPQNISGAIGGPRVRFLATMPRRLNTAASELHRFINGGSFPRLRSSSIEEWTLIYFDRLKADEKYNNEDTRAALDRIADGLIREALTFIDEIMIEAKYAQKEHFPDDVTPPEIIRPSITSVLLRRAWEKDGYDKARFALSTPHFSQRSRKAVERND